MQDALILAAAERFPGIWWAKDLEGRYVMTSPNFAEATRASGDVIGRTDVEVFGPERAELYREGDRRALEGTFQTRHECTEGTVWLISKFTFAHDGLRYVGGIGVSASS